MCWAWLFLAISLEVAATVCLKLTDGFSRAWPTVAMVVLYVLSFPPMAIAIREMDVAVAYAVWSAVGTAALAVIGMLLFKESVSAWKFASIALILVGVISLNLSETRRRPPNQPGNGNRSELASTAADPNAPDAKVRGVK